MCFTRWLLGAAIAVVALLAAPPPAHAQIENIVTASAQGYTISGLVSRLAEATAFRYGVALFPGHPGIMRLREEDGRARFELGGNFLVRSRHDWPDRETLVVTLDAPSDQWSSFDQRSRAGRGQARACAVRCPFVTIFDAAVRNTRDSGFIP